MTCVCILGWEPQRLLTESGSGELGIIVCDRVPWLYQYWPGGFLLFVVLCPGTPGGSTGSGSGSGFKRFRFSMHILTIKYL